MARNAKSSITRTPRTVAALKHADKRKNIPTAEFQAVLRADEQKPTDVRYLRNRDLDPQLVWRGKDEQDWSDLVVHAPPLYIQEKVHPKVLIDALFRQRKEEKRPEDSLQADLFADFNGIPKEADKTAFYQYDQNWSNRMILGDSLQVMASLAEREGLRGKVQCIYFDPPYGIKFNSNFQWSTTTRDVTDGKRNHITREPEQVRAFRDTWRDGIHTYLTHLRDRFNAARELLTESGSMFVQIGDENVHRVRAALDEVFGETNFIAQITIEKTSSQTQDYLSPVTDYLLWFAKSRNAVTYRPCWLPKHRGQSGFAEYSRLVLPDLSRRSMVSEERANVRPLPAQARVYRQDNLTSTGSHGSEKGTGGASWFTVRCEGRDFTPSLQSIWKTSETGMTRLGYAGRLEPRGSSLSYVRFLDDFPAVAINNIWDDVKFSSRAEDKTYVVQTASRVVQRCILMATDPGDLVLDPTCGSGTTAYVAEQWGRRWITVDTSRVALALARARIMGARYPYYLLADSRDGQVKEAEITRSAPSSHPVRDNIRHGFVYQRVPHITLRSIANNAEIDLIWEKWQPVLDRLREKLNAALRKKWQEWEVPRDTDAKWSDAVRKLHAEWWKARIARQSAIDASIAAKGDFEYLYDKPYEDSRRVRVAGPFTVESVSPHRILAVGPHDEVVDTQKFRDSGRPEYNGKRTFADVILDSLKVAGVQQAHKADKITFNALSRWPGNFVCADGRYMEGDTERRAAIFIGPEFGTVQRVDLVAAGREAAEAGFDVLVACAFNYEAHTTEFGKLGRLPVLKARMNADLHMAENLKNTGKGNLFVVFGEPDLTLIREKDGLVRVKVNGVDVFKPQTGEVVSDNADGIACWFIDTDYNEESFFVRHAYFLGANDPYGALKTTLKAEVDPEAWESLRSDTSRPFKLPASGRIAVKVINHLGDEVMKIFRV
jgi:adenine-specific DNA-methyltransferase